MRRNLEKIIELRNTSTHFITEEYEMVYIPLFQACVLNFVDKMNEKYKKSMKCFECRKDWFETGKETCNNAEIHFNSSGHGSRCTVFCVNDVNDKLNKNYIESPNEYHYQKIGVLDVKKIL